MELRNKIIVLWLITMLGFLSHSLMELLPLFWGVDVTVSATGEIPQAMFLMMAVFCYLLPVCGIACLFFKHKGWLIANAVLACFIGLFNVIHAGMDLFPSENTAQYVIIPTMVVAGVFLAWYSVRLAINEQ